MERLLKLNCGKLTLTRHLSVAAFQHDRIGHYWPNTVSGFNLKAWFKFGKVPQGAEDCRALNITDSC